MKKNGKGSNDHMTVGKGEIENVTVVSQRSHDRWNLEMKGGATGGEGSREGKGERRGERGGGVEGESKERGGGGGGGRGAGLSYLGPWAEP